MTLLHDRFPGLTLEHLPLGEAPTPVDRLGPALVDDVEVWVKHESAYGEGGWGGNKVRKLGWIIPEAQRRGVRTLFTVGGIGTHWGLAAALYGREHGLHTLLGLVDQPVDDHVRAQLGRLERSGAQLHRYRTPARLRLAAPGLVARALLRDRRLPWYLPAGGSNEYGALAYVEVALEIAEQVRRGELPEPATLVTAVGSGGTAAGLALGLRLAGLRTRVFGVVVNDAFPLTAEVITGLADKTAELMTRSGAPVSVRLRPEDVTMRTDWLGTTYGDPTPASVTAVRDAATAGLTLEPVYTGKALAAMRDETDSPAMRPPILWLNTHGPR
jgi:D-cysteine desulfhydrase